MNSELICHHAYRGNLEELKSNIEKVEDYNCRNQLNLTPLACAAIGGRKDVVEYLLENGANPQEQVGQNGWSVVKRCALNNDVAYEDRLEMLHLMVLKKPEIAGEVIKIINQPNFRRSIASATSPHIMEVESMIAQVNRDNQRRPDLSEIDLKFGESSDASEIDHKTPTMMENLTSAISSLTTSFSQILPSSSIARATNSQDSAAVQPLLTTKGKKEKSS